MRLPTHRLFVPILVTALGFGSAAFAVTGATSDDVPVAQDEVVEPTPLPEDTTEPTDPPLDTDPPVETDVPEVSDPPVVDEPVPTDPPAGDTVTDEPKKARSTEGCPEGFSGNHGQYVSSTTDKPKNEAAHSECGKPIKSDNPNKPVKTPKPAKTAKPEPSGAPEPTDPADASDEPPTDGV